MRSFFLLLLPFSRVKFLSSKAYLPTTPPEKTFQRLSFSLNFVGKTCTATESFSKHSFYIRKRKKKKPLPRYYPNYCALNQCIFPLEQNIWEQNKLPTLSAPFSLDLVGMTFQKATEIVGMILTILVPHHYYLIDFTKLCQTCTSIGKLELRAYAPGGNRDTWAYPALRFLGSLSQVSWNLQHYARLNR